MDELKALFQKWIRQLRRLPQWACGTAILVCIVLVAVIVNPGQETTVSQAKVDPFQSPTILAVDVFLKFLVVIGLIYLAYFLLRRWKEKHLAAGSRQLAIKESLHLSPKRSIHLVQAGNRTLLIGATDQAVSFLADIDPFQSTSLSSPDPTQVDFSSLLEKCQPFEQR